MAVDRKKNICRAGEVSLITFRLLQLGSLAVSTCVRQCRGATAQLPQQGSPSGSVAFRSSFLSQCSCKNRSLSTAPGAGERSSCGTVRTLLHSCRVSTLTGHLSTSESQSCTFTLVRGRLLSRGACRRALMALQYYRSSAVEGR